MGTCWIYRVSVMSLLCCAALPRAVLCCKVLCCAVLPRAVLRCEELCCVAKCSAVLCFAALCCAALTMMFESLLLPNRLDCCWDTIHSHCQCSSQHWQQRHTICCALRRLQHHCQSARIGTARLHDHLTLNDHTCELQCGKCRS